MPRPPMSDVITIMEPLVDDNGNPVTDIHSRPKYKEVTSRARVQHTTKVIRNTQGRETQALLAIDLPSDIKIASGYEVHWIDRFKQLVKGAVIGIDETLNFTGNKVYFRTVYIG